MTDTICAAVIVIVVVIGRETVIVLEVRGGAGSLF